MCIESRAREGGGEIVPVDSEHSAVLQCITGRRPGELARLILTASGGPFRTWNPERVAGATVDEALRHPTWKMGKKITVDSASLVNKALEVIEAHFLFGLPYEAVDVVVHPQSVVHAFVEFVDGSVLAQVGFPTMELPILYALTHPDRVPDAGARRFDPVAAGTLTFEPVDAGLYPAYGLGRAAAAAGGAAPTAFHAANEAAGGPFLGGRVPFGRRGETEYWLSWLPLGGYVKMAGLEDEGVAGGVEGGKSAIPIDPARAFDRQPVWKRTIVILAGVTMNAVFAFLIYSGLAATAGTPELASTEIDSVATHSLPPGTEALASLKFGDRIVRVNGDTVRSWNALLDHILAGPTTLRVEVAGRPEAIVVQLSDGGLATPQGLAQALTRLDPPRLGLVEPGRPAIRAGLRPGDLLVRANGDTARSWSEGLRTVWGR